VRWPSGLAERFANPKVDSIVTLTEGRGDPVKEVVKPATN